MITKSAIDNKEEKIIICGASFFITGFRWVHNNTQEGGNHQFPKIKIQWKVDFCTCTICSSK